MHTNFVIVIILNVCVSVCLFGAILASPSFDLTLISFFFHCPRMLQILLLNFSLLVDFIKCAFLSHFTKLNRHMHRHTVILLLFHILFSFVFYAHGVYTFTLVAVLKFNMMIAICCKNNTATATTPYTFHFARIVVVAATTTVIVTAGALKRHSKLKKNVEKNKRIDDSV